jgi:hypothetical protein
MAPTQHSYYLTGTYVKEAAMPPAQVRVKILIKELSGSGTGIEMPLQFRHVFGRVPLTR